MSKQCQGKYHGSGIKYIDDNEKYCKICQQKMRYKKKIKSEIVTGVVGTILIGLAAMLSGINSHNNKK